MRPSDIARVLAAVTLAAWPGAADEARAPGGSAALEAERLSISADGREVTASGSVRLVTEGLELRGERLELSLPDGAIHSPAPFTLRLPDIYIAAASGELSRDGRSLRLERPTLTRAAPPPPFLLRGERIACDGGRCVLLGGVGTACPHVPAGYRLEARRLTLHPSGDVDLVSPTLVLGGVRAAWLPWLRLRPPEKAGFLAPRLGYSRDAGLIAGPAGHLPLGHGAHADGYVAGRTSQGLEDETRVLAEGVDLRVQHVFDAPDNRARARLALRAPLAGATFAADADLVTDGVIIDELTFDPLERAMSRTESRVLVSLPSSVGTLESSFGADQPLAPGTRGGWPDVQTVAAVRGTLVAVPNRARLWPSLDLSLARRDVSRGSISYDASGYPARPHTRLLARPSLTAPLHLGPVTLDARVGSRHATWLVDRETGGAPANHSAGGAARFGLPLVGRLAGRPHLIAPRVEYRAVPWAAGATPPWVFDAADRPRRAHAVELGVETALDPFAEVPVFYAEIAERVGLPGLGEAKSRRFLHGAVRIGAPVLELRGEIAWDQELLGVSAAAAGIGTRDGRGNGISVDARWYGEGAGPHTDGRWTADDVTSMGDSWWPAGPRNRLELAERGTAVVARVVALHCGARVEIAPRPGLNALWYGLGLRAPCGCAEIALQAAHRLDTPAPDVMLVVTLE